MAKAYRLVARPADVAHEHPFFVFDCQHQPHFYLIRFGKLATKALALSTVRAYLYALLPYFTWLDTDPRQVEARQHWQQTPDQVRFCVDDYLTQCMKCQIQEHKNGFQLVRRTAKTPSQLKPFLVALKCFYKLMGKNGYYHFSNPLVDPVSGLLTDLEDDNDEATYPPRMPDISGVEKPFSSRERLTDSYFKLEGEEWIPQIVDNPDLPKQVLLAGEQFPQWGIREQCVTRLLFETGGRISEVVGLTLDDWMKLGLKQEIHTFSKGSRGIRIKTLRCSVETCTLLWRYFNTERVKYDPSGYTLYDYQKQAKLNEVDLSTVPLFLTTQRTTLTSQNFRDNYWKPALEQAGIELDIHQARHYYVTSAIRQIYTLASDQAAIERLKRSLVAYMKWRSPDTIKAYDHYFDQQLHADMQDVIHTRMYSHLNQSLEEEKEGLRPPSVVSTPVVSPVASDPSTEDDDFNFFRRIGG